MHHFKAHYPITLSFRHPVYKKLLFGVIVLVMVSSLSGFKPVKKQKPNIIYIMLDDIGYFEPSYMGNKKLETPNIDKMAEEGMIFTNAYAGASVCAPTRACIMTGKHMGHTSIRGNSGGLPIRADEETIASMLKKAGYKTGGFGKWGIGNRGTSGVPEIHGFDIFFGYYDQVHAHSYYPEYLIRNSKEVMLEGNEGYYYKGKINAQDKIFEESVKFIRENADKPFFCYLPWTPPHGLWGIDEKDPAYLHFKDKPWKVHNSWREDDPIRYAALLYKADSQIGEIFRLLKKLGIDKNTIVFFSGDNGGQRYFKSKKFPDGIFGPNVNPETGRVFRGEKRSVYEGGLRIPMVVRWPAKIKPGTISDIVWYFPDVMATVADIVNVKVPADCDGQSLLPTLTGKGKQKVHKYMFWTAGRQWAVRSGDWKAVSIPAKEKGGKVVWELYDLKNDPGETNDLSINYPKKLQKLVKYASEAYEEPVGGEIYDKELFLKDHNINKPMPRRIK